MSSHILPFALLFILSVVHISGQMMGEVTDGEKKVCQDNADSKDFTGAKKDRRLSCRVICSYSDGTEKNLASPDGQQCCDVMGVGPTGTCKNGSCPIGNSGK